MTEVRTDAGVPDGAPTVPWRTLRTHHLEVAVRWPGGRVPATLVVDDPMPGLNPMTHHEPAHPHRHEIPNEVLRRFADLSDRHGIRGKFSVVPWPLSLGRIDRPDTLPEASRRALPEFLELVRSRIAPRYDITCEYLTHSWAIDLATGRPTSETEKQWASHATAEEFAETIALAGHILGEAGIVMDGVTSPWDAGEDNEAAYAEGVALAMRRFGARIPWYFVHIERSLDVLPTIAHRDALGPTISVPTGVWHDPGWQTQKGEAPHVDPLIAADGEGRVSDLVRAGRPVVLFTHWQALYGNGSFGGLDAIDTLCTRVHERHGAAVEWAPIHRHAEMAAACDTLDAHEQPPQGGGSWALRLATPFAVPLADITLRPLTDEGREWLSRPLGFCGTPVGVRRRGDGAATVRIPLGTGTLAPLAPG